MIDSEAVLPSNLFLDERSAITARQRLERAVGAQQAAVHVAQLAAYEQGLRDALECPVAKHDQVLRGLANTIQHKRKEMTA